MAAQRVKLYLEKHKIGVLFEDLMAKVIKDMPNDPVAFLIELLQQLYRKKHPEKMRPSSSYTQRTGLGLTGTPAPKRSEQEPPMVLPGGGRTMSSAWASNDLEKLKSTRVSFEESGKRREYEKPWQAGSKQSKYSDEIRRSLKNGVNREKPGWNSDTKVPSHDFDEWIQYQETLKTKEVESKVKEKKPYYLGVRSWADTTDAGNQRSNNKSSENFRQPIARASDYSDTDIDEDIDYPIKSKHVNFDDVQSTTTDNDSLLSMTKPNRQSAKDQADDRKKQLQVLLSGDSKHKNERKTQVNERDSSDEGFEVFESTDDLEDEGIVKSGGKAVRFAKSHRDRCSIYDDVKVRICGRCARLMAGDDASMLGANRSDAGTFVWSTRKSYTDVMNSEDDDFESVSQIGKNMNKLPAWPVISDSEAGDTTPRPRSSKQRSRGEVLPLKKELKNRSDSFPSARSLDGRSTRSQLKGDHDYLFSGDSRAYQKNNAKRAGYLTDTETEIGARSLVSGFSDLRVSGVRGWAMKTIATDSEADTEESGSTADIPVKRASRNARSYLR